VTLQTPLKSSFGRRSCGRWPQLPGSLSTGSCPYRLCRRRCLQAGLAERCLSWHLPCSPGRSPPSLEPARTCQPTCPPRPSSRQGPYCFTRNPIYLGMMLGLVGLAIAFDSLWLLVMLVPFFLVIRYGVVAREEAYLERKFGEVYRRYRACVRRWL
jgi:hypothetical protein